MLLHRVAKALDTYKVPYAIVGGYAVALHGALRGTLDIDIVLRLKKEDFLKAEKALTAMGLKPRLPVTAEEIFDFREEYIRNRNLIAWSFANPQDPSEIVDVIITSDLNQLDTKTIIHQGQKIRILDVDSLIQMKQQSNRPQDQEDIRMLRILKGKK